MSGSEEGRAVMGGVCPWCEDGVRISDSGESSWCSTCGVHWVMKTDGRPGVMVRTRKESIGVVSVASAWRLVPEGTLLVRNEFDSVP